MSCSKISQGGGSPHQGPGPGGVRCPCAKTWFGHTCHRLCSQVSLGHLDGQVLRSIVGRLVFISKIAACKVDNISIEFVTSYRDLILLVAKEMLALDADVLADNPIHCAALFRTT